MAPFARWSTNSTTTKIQNPRERKTFRERRAARVPAGHCRPLRPLTNEAATRAGR